MTTVRPAAEYAFALLRLIREYYETSPLLKKLPFNEEWVAHELWNSFGRGDLIVVALVDGEVAGLLWASAARYLFSGASFVYDQLCYVRPQFRSTTAFRKMFRSFEQWARENGAVDHIRVGALASPENAKVARFLRRNGYVDAGYVLIKQL